MSTLTIRKIPEAILDRLKAAASRKDHSMEQEVRELLKKKYATTPEIASRIQKRWKELPKTTPAKIKTWRQVGRS